MAHHRLAAAVQLPGPGQLAPGDVSTLDRLGEAQQLGGDEEPAGETARRMVHTALPPLVERT